MEVEDGTKIFLILSQINFEGIYISSWLSLYTSNFASEIYAKEKIF